MIKSINEVEIQSEVDRLVLLMRQLGYRQYEFAKLLDYTPSYFESVINGRVPFTESFRERINDFLTKRAEEQVANEEMCSVSERGI